MPYKMHPKQYENVLSLSSRDRYLHFVGKVADWEKLWGLYEVNDGWLLRTSPDNTKYISVWPHPAYANEISKEYYPNYKEKVINIQEFMDDFLPKLKEENIKVGVFPDLNGSCIIIDAIELLEDLRGECDLYE